MQESHFAGQHHHAHQHNLEQQVLEQTLRQATSLRGSQTLKEYTLQGVGAAAQGVGAKAQTGKRVAGTLMRSVQQQPDVATGRY